MAQFEEEGKAANMRKRVIKAYVRSGNYIKLEQLTKMQGIPENSVDLFYAQSASVVDHLLTGNIRSNFGRLLTRLKRGDSLESALKDVYQWKYKNGISDLEKRWKDFVKKKY